jgi:hypothetical protein
MPKPTIYEFVDVETAKRTGRPGFGELLGFLRRSPSCRVLLVEKPDQLYRNLKGWVTLDEIDLEVHLVKENVVLSRDSRSCETVMHGINVLMATNHIDNRSEETRKGVLKKAEQGAIEKRREGPDLLVERDRASRAPPTAGDPWHAGRRVVGAGIGRGRGPGTGLTGSGGRCRQHGEGHGRTCLLTVYVDRPGALEEIHERQRA